jgi:hypothetical protein
MTVLAGVLAHVLGDRDIRVSSCDVVLLSRLWADTAKSAKARTSLLVVVNMVAVLRH